MTTLGEGDDDDADEDDIVEIPLPNVKATVLAKVIEYCTHYKDEPMTTITTPLKSNRVEEIVQEWYANFVKVEQIMLFELVTAANFMDIKPLLDLTCLAVSVYIKVSSICLLKKFVWGILKLMAIDSSLGTQQKYLNEWLGEIGGRDSKNFQY